MNEEKGNTNMTVGVVLTVAVAILLLVAMIPAMMPAGEAEAYTYHYTLVEGDQTAGYTVKYAYMDEEGTVTSTLGCTTISVFIWTPGITTDNGGKVTGYLEFYKDVVDAPRFYGQPDYFSYNGYRYYYDQFMASASDVLPNECWLSPSDLQVTWDCFTCPNVVLPGQTFDPSSAVPDPSEGGDAPVDTNTVLIGAIISLLFISIALVAVRSFRA